jgi:carbonic anhydrase
MAVNSYVPPAPPNTPRDLAPTNPTNPNTTQRILAVTCLDFRGHTVIRRFLEEAGYADRYDLVSMAGADLCLTHDACPVAWADTLLDNVTIGVALHDIKEVWVFAHQDCGACKKFGLVGGDMSATTERSVHHSIAETSRAVMAERFPNVVVRHHFVSGVSGVNAAFCTVDDQ